MRPLLPLAALLATASLSARAGEAPAFETLPASRGGQDLVGQVMPALTFDRWLGTPGNRPLDTAGHVTLYRWWTDGCPFCEATLPAVDELRRTYGAKGLLVVAVYHPKPKGPVADAAVAKWAAERHYGGPVAIDARWTALDRLWLSTGDRTATSVSVLVDAHGVIRFVHPGTEYFPSSSRSESQQNADYEMLRHDVELLLGVRP